LSTSWPRRGGSPWAAETTRWWSEPAQARLIFPAPDGDHQDGTTVLHRFQRRLREVGLPRMTLYLLRHGHATLQLTQGAGLREIRAQLGYTQVSTTANIYTHIAPELRRKAAERIDRVFG
jgi:integrase